MADLVVGIAGLAVAGPPIIVPILQAGMYIRTILQKYREAHSLNDQNLLQLDLHVFQAENLARSVQERFTSLDAVSQVLLDRVIKVLEKLFVDFSAALAGNVDKSGELRRIHFAFRGHNAVERMNKCIGDWERSFYNVIFSILLTGGRKVPSALANKATKQLHSRQQLDGVIDMFTQTMINPADGKSLRLDKDKLEEKDCVLIPNSRFLYNNGSEPFIIEHHQSTASPEEVRDIAAFLRGVDASIVALLPCEGFLDQSLRFKIPRGFIEPCSLRSALIFARNDGIKHSLDSRLTLMRKLASSLLFIHTADHVHKSIRPDNIILLFQSISAAIPSMSRLPYHLGEPFLLGFDLSRKSQKATEYTKTTQWWKALYLPPDRQGDPQRPYSMLDDVYSLGVTLLEITLWTSFAVLDVDPITNKTSWMRTSVLLDDNVKPPTPLGPEKLRQRFLSLAKKEVARKMGSTISSLILACLSCLDDSESFGDRKELEDQDGIVMGITYIKKVLLVLDEVSM